MSQEIRTPEEMQRVMKAPFPPSDEQWAAITAPLSPVVVIAGAGSGKTTLMAARVVYLVLTGQVRSEEVLGLTFTTKAAAELRQRIRGALTAAGALDLKASADDEEVLEPTVATYNAYAANLLTDHGLRIGHEPDTRVITDAARYQLGARAVDRYDGPVEKLSDHPPTVIQNLLALDGSMSEHLVDPDPRLGAGQDHVVRVDPQQVDQLLAAPLGLRAGEVDLVHGDDNGHSSGLGVLDRVSSLVRGDPDCGDRVLPHVGARLGGIEGHGRHRTGLPHQPALRHHAARGRGRYRGRRIDALRTGMPPRART